MELQERVAIQDPTAEHDVLTLYLREVRRTELFTAEQEFISATLARAGDF